VHDHVEHGEAVNRASILGYHCRGHPPDMPFLPGTRVSSYEIVSPLGQGGMGEVYRARDRKLGRDVALKLLPQTFMADPTRLARFYREAQVLASLNHPHIAQIHGLEEEQGTCFLVLELVEGATLAERLKQGPLPLDDAVRIAGQIADALETAHEKGVVHRDLKPANVALTTKGQVKVLDFGLAKAPDDAASQSDLTNSPTLTSPMMLSNAGVILGTAAYMSPEQARGKPVDHRADVWALGCVLYEMLTCVPPFKGESIADVLVSILTQDPDWHRLPSTAPPTLRRILMGALEKNVDYRTGELRLLRVQLESLERAGVRYEPSRSLAVLPFAFLNDVEERQALSLGFADALITTLGNVEDLIVAPTSAILRYAPGADPRRVCLELGVAQALQGYVQKLGAQWRVSIQIFDAATQRITFSEKHDFRMEDVFEVQDEIGRRVAAALAARFSAVAPKSRDRYSSDPEAYAEFMAGLRDSYEDSPDALQRAADHLGRAVARDADFALAHAWLSHVCMQICYYFDAGRGWLERAEHHCHRALTLDQTLAEGHWARAAIVWSPAHNFRHADAIVALERALDSRPNFDRAYNRLATICMHIGRFEEARRAHEHAVRSNPANPSRNREWLLLYTGQFVEAEAAADAWLRDAPSNWSAQWYGPQPALMLGHLDVAERHLAQSQGKNATEPLLVSLQGMLEAKRGRRDAALACVQQALDVPLSLGHAHHTYYQVACVYAVLGNIDKAVAWLQRSADTGNQCWPFFRIDPHLESLNPHEGFQQLLARLERECTAVRIRPV